MGPLSSNDPAVEHGKIVFARKCNSCHPGGEGGLGPGLNDKLLPVFAMKLHVRTGLVGFKAMPSFDQHSIPSEDLDDLMAYLKALRKQHRPMETTQVLVRFNSSAPEGAPFQSDFRYSTRSCFS